MMRSVERERLQAERLRLYSYATAPESGSYVAIMRMFAGALLADWSAQDLVERGLEVPAAVVEERLRYLEQHGNLLASPREVRVTSIAEYQRQPARYTATSLGIRVHRQVEEVMAAAGGAREVPRELLAAVAQRLTTLATLSPTDLAAADPAAVAETVSTLFLQFETFAAAVTDFYSYVGSVVVRADLEDDEWLGFKHLLLDYLETIVQSVARNTPAIRLALDRLAPNVPLLVERATAADPALEALRAATLHAATLGGEGVERTRGRSVDDWAALRAWFGAAGDRTSGSSELRAAAVRAVGALLANVKRMNAASSRETSLRRHFLRLARWFDAATPDEAHVLFTSAFGLYGARHLGVLLDPDVADALPATTSWWQAPAAPVAVSMRERGDRTPRGRIARAVDHSAQKRRLAAESGLAGQRREQAVAELLAVGDRLDGVRISAAAFEVLVELLGRATARLGPDLAGATAALIDAGLVLWMEPCDGPTTVRSATGDLTVHGFRLAVTASGRQPAPPDTGRIAEAE
jgi:uncharacterized protein (TIGR02677 family)